MRARFADHFAEVPIEEASHVVEIMDDVVYEHGPRLKLSLLPRRLVEALREPVVVVHDRDEPLSYTTRYEPDGTWTNLETAPPIPSPWQPTVTWCFAPDKSRPPRWNDGVDALAARIKKRFPIRAPLARLDCQKAGFFSNAPSDGLHLSCDLQLALYRATGDGDREMIDLRKQVQLLVMRVDPQGDFVFDEWIASHEASFDLLHRKLTRLLGETTDWTGVTPESLIEE
ncbi:MAG: hypothetical protein QM831_46165 [Kofleriaceae bacterium]